MPRASGNEPGSSFRLPGSSPAPSSCAPKHWTSYARISHVRRRYARADGSSTPFRRTILSGRNAPLGQLDHCIEPRVSVSGYRSRYWCVSAIRTGRVASNRAFATCCGLPGAHRNASPRSSIRCSWNAFVCTRSPQSESQFANASLVRRAQEKGVDRPQRAIKQFASKARTGAWSAMPLYRIRPRMFSLPPVFATRRCCSSSITSIPTKCVVAICSIW